MQDGLLIAGGSFTRIGDLEARGVAAWNGSEWSTLGEFGPTNVLELAPYPGGFLALAETPIVSRWDGSSWHILPGLPPEATYPGDIAVLGDQVAVAAYVYDAVATEWRGRVYLYSGSGWTQLGDTFSKGVFALAWYNGALYAGGGFKYVGSAFAPFLVRWDGSAWLPAADGLPAGATGFGGVEDLAVYQGELVACGVLGSSTDPNVEPQYFARWNGTRWAGLGSSASMHPNFRRLRVVGTDLFALGQFWSTHHSGTARWDGVTWHVGEDSLETLVFDIAEYQSVLYAGGLLTNDGQRPAPPIVRRKNGRWEGLVSPDQSMQGLMGWAGPEINALAAANEGVVAAGRIDLAGSPDGWLSSPLSATWTGTRWSPSGYQPWLYAVARDIAVHDGELYAVGDFQLPTTTYSVVRLEGGTWRLFGNNSPVGIGNADCVASVLGSLVISGGGQIARWGGMAWSPMGRVTLGNGITAITEFGDEMIVGGDFREVDGVRCRNVAAWSPSRGWHPLGEGLGPVYALLARDGVLYAAGESGVTRWRKGRWESLSTGGGWWALGWFHGRLVSSSYSLPGLVGILEADSTWHPLGSGVDGPVLSFVESGPSLFMGGYFSEAGGHASYGFAEWREDGYNRPIPPIPPGPLISRVTVGPNPSAAVVQLSYDLAAAAQVRVEIHDISGRLVDTPHSGYQSAGPHNVYWLPPSHARAGVYLATVTAAGASQTVRVVRID